MLLSSNGYLSRGRILGELKESDKPICLVSNELSRNGQRSKVLERLFPAKSEVLLDLNNA